MDNAKKHRIHQERSYVVRQTVTARRMRLVLIPLFVLALPAVASLLTYYYFGSEERQLTQQITSLEAEVAELVAELSLSGQMRTNAEVSSEVDQQAIEGLRKELVSWEEKYGQQEEKVKFYQSLMDPNPTNSGVYLQDVEIEATLEEGVYDYRILVAQRSSNHTRVSGSVQVNLISKKNSDGIQTISLKELTPELDELTLGFKFFQQFDGSFTLPAGFEPDQLQLVVNISGNSSARFEEYIDWTERS